MKLKFLLALIATSILICSCENTSSEKGGHSRTGSSDKMQNMEDSMNYILGMSMTQQFSYFNEDDYRPDMMALAMNDFLNGKEYRIGEEAKKEILTEYFRWARAFKDDSLLRETNRFLKKNAKLDNVIVSKRGLQYTYLNKGSEVGISPDGNDVVYVRYVQGSEQSGKQWDQAMATNTRDTISMALNRELTGFSQMCQLMKVGDKVKAWLPAVIGSAEGRDPAGLAVKNECMWMEIELLKITERSIAQITEEELATYPGYFFNEEDRKK